MQTCVVENCRNKPTKQSNITFHVFPKNKKIRQKWIEAINKKKFIPSKFSRVCSKHFEPECYLKNKKKRLLKKDAVPTIFNDDNNKLSQNTPKIKFPAMKAMEPSPDVNEEVSISGFIKEEIVTTEHRFNRLPNNMSPVSSTSNSTTSSHSTYESEVEDFIDEIFSYKKAEMSLAFVKKYMAKQKRKIIYLQGQNRNLKYKIHKLKTSMQYQTRFGNINMTFGVNI